MITRASCTTVAQLSRHQTFICYKKSQVRKRDSFAHTSLRSKDKQSNFDCKRDNKNHSPTIIIQQLTDWKEYTVMHAKGTTVLPANFHLFQKKKRSCDTLTYLMALQHRRRNRGGAGGAIAPPAAIKGGRTYHSAPHYWLLLILFTMLIACGVNYDRSNVRAAQHNQLTLKFQQFL